MPLSLGQPRMPAERLTPAEYARLFALTPEEAVAYLRDRRMLSPTFDWRDLWHEEHAAQFTVSRMTRLDLLESIRDGITRSVAGDLSRRDWMRDIKALLQEEGWWGEQTVIDPQTGKSVITTFDPARLKLIYDTNVNMAYSAGLWQRIERNRATSPYIRYITRRDERVRISHRAWDNVALPVEHPFWDTHFPPNGWRCRCRAMSLSQSDYDTLKAQGRIRTEAPPMERVRWLNKRTGEVMEIPAGIDPGFDYNPGKAVLARKGQLLLAKAVDAEPRAAATAIREAMQNRSLLAATTESFARFVEPLLSGGAQAAGDARHVGALAQKDWVAMWRRGEAPGTAIISVRDEDVARALPGAVTDATLAGWYARLPEHLLQPDAVLLDRTRPGRPAILYVYDLPARGAKRVLRIMPAGDGKRLWVEDVETVDAGALAGRIGRDYERIR